MNQRAIVADLLSKESERTDTLNKGSVVGIPTTGLTQPEAADLMHVNRELVIQARAVREAENCTSGDSLAASLRPLAASVARSNQKEVIYQLGN